MNPKIKELMIRAMTETGRLEEGVQASYQRFASLIVQECIEVLETNNANLTSDFKWDAIHEIEKHFGVKK